VTQGLEQWCSGFGVDAEKIYPDALSDIFKVLCNPAITASNSAYPVEQGRLSCEFWLGPAGILVFW
jgi:hypothetical protein